MMNSLKNWLPVALLLLVMMSCAPGRIPFTQQLREKHQLKPEEMKLIQFYISNDLILSRGDQQLKKETKEGELTLLKDATVEEFIIKAGTPCVIQEVVDGNRVSVGFENAGNKYLVFGSLKNRDGYYTLQALDWNKNRGRVNYGEKMYLTSPGSRDVFLVLKVKSLEKFKLDQKVLKGREIGK